MDVVVYCCVQQRCHRPREMGVGRGKGVAGWVSLSVYAFFFVVVVDCHHFKPLWIKNNYKKGTGLKLVREKKKNNNKTNNK